MFYDVVCNRNFILECQSAEANDGVGETMRRLDEDVEWRKHVYTRKFVWTLSNGMAFGVHFVLQYFLNPTMV